MKRILLAILFCASQAAAESHTLSSHKAWDVAFQNFTNRDACSMTSQNNAGHILDFTIWDDGEMQMFAFFNTEYDLWYDEVYDAKFNIGKTDWTLPDADWNQSHMAFTFQRDDAAAFFEDVIQGNSITLIDPEGADVTAWSLAGSQNAFVALVACFKRLEGAPA
ncbi:MULTISPECIES: hypothetical protein [Halocynthiibacter]|uniref:Uncharacterized protein n=1 Tax=Halocynthiibacter halioticoli TaxID=2986804 RepID=A0AAE3LUV5_9RHOB|nr:MULTISPECIES: hypothetical protein [Halocynthiibacter]MCV6826035.1 hypothetical protein [Halocynthiibacter halioticoli]MCW4059036.1 hypothetical protein [Halocynthiibacter sp. SDUM655004]